MIAFFLSWRNERRRARHEAIREEVRAAFAAAGGRAAQRKRKAAIYAKCRQLCAEMGKPVPEALR